MLLRPVETKLIEAPATIGNERMVQFVTGGNILVTSSNDMSASSQDVSVRFAIILI